MNWIQLEYLFNDATQPFQRLAQSHLKSSFRLVLASGVLFILLSAALLYEPLFTYWQCSAWLAGLSATLVVLFLCSATSVSIKGYHIFYDRWIAGIVGSMLFISIFFGVVTLILIL
jgi:hypothetical protein